MFFEHCSPPSTNKSFCMLIGHHKIHIIFEWLVGTRGAGGGGGNVAQSKM